MEKRVSISPADCQEIEYLYYDYTAQLELIQHLLKEYPELDETPMLEKRWEKLLQSEILLNRRKADMDQKYHPKEGHYTNYLFEFNTNTLIYFTQDQ